jgi:hypothetical protein
MILDGIFGWILNPENFLTLFFYISSLIIAFIISFYVARHYSPKAEPVYQQVAFRIIEPTKSILPKQVKIYYGDENVPRLTKYYLVFWNRGAANLDGATMQPKDPICLTFDEGSQIYEVTPLASIKPTVDLKWEIEGNKLFFTFNDLEQNEGFNLEILHTGINGLPFMGGSFRNIPNGPSNLGQISSDQWPETTPKKWWNSVSISDWGLVFGGILITYLCITAFNIGIGLLTCFIDGLMIYYFYTVYWKRRRLYPKNLEIRRALIK